MKIFLITVTRIGVRTSYTGPFKSSFDATLSGMDHLDENDPSGRVSAEQLK